MQQLAFPHNEVLPSDCLQFGLSPQIPLAVTLQFGPPKVQLRFWHSCQFAGRIRVSMPKTSVDKNRLAAGFEHQARRAGEAAIVEEGSETPSVAQPPHYHLRVPLDASHPRPAV